MTRTGKLFCTILPVVIPVLWPVSSGCTPSLRYTRDNPDSAAPKHHYYYVARKQNPVIDKPQVTEPRLCQIVESYKGIRYKYGGMSRRGTDCSGLICMVFLELNNTKLPHSSSKLFSMGVPIFKSQAQIGDLVFFRGPYFNVISHVGIYMGDNQFVHATSGAGVIISSMDDPAYAKHMVGIRRIY